MTKVVVLDTNVLLAEPTAILSFPRSDVVIPETVLGELDKLKTARVDPDLRFRGREVSRILFDLSEEGSLVEGVELPDGGTLKVVPFVSETPLPAGMQTRNSDDRILASVFQARETYGPDAEITLVTNDLNMLLKAQTLGIQVERHGDGGEGGWGRRYIVRPFQRYRAPITILAVAIAVFIAVIVLVVYTQPRNQGSGSSSTNLPPEFKNVLTSQQQAAFDALSALNTLQANPKDPESLRRMAAFYYDQYTALAQTDPTTALSSAYQSIRYTDRYLQVAPNDSDAKVDEAALLFYTGQADKAIQLVGDVLKVDKNHVKGNFNLGIFLWQSRHDYTGAAAQFEKVIALTSGDSHAADVQQNAQAALAQLRKDAAAAGHPLPASTTPTAGVTTP